MDKKCAPGKLYNNGSCFTVDNLIDISKHFNRSFPNRSFKIINDKKYLLKNLTSRMKDKFDCNDQTCWINTNFIKKMRNDEISNFTFRPEGPAEKYDWLSTSDINKVMKQYEQKYNDFKFLGAVPYDFEDLSYLDTYKLNINNLKSKGKYKIGMVVNLDPHTEPGSHWVAFYTNLKNNQIFFFDSFAKKPGDRIQKFANKFITELSGGGGNTKLKYNQIRHQFSNSECGVYSMNFIIRLLNGETFNSITNNITKDTDMNACRNVYFRDY